MKCTNPGKLRRQRKKLGYTQVDLAALVGCTQQYISLIESGLDSDCSEKIALALCKRLHLDLEDVFEEREIFGTDKNPNPKAVSRKAAA